MLHDCLDLFEKIISNLLLVRILEVTGLRCKFVESYKDVSKHFDSSLIINILSKHSWLMLDSDVLHDGQRLSQVDIVLCVDVVREVGEGQTKCVLHLLPLLSAIRSIRLFLILDT